MYMYIYRESGINAKANKKYQLQNIKSNIQKCRRTTFHPIHCRPPFAKAVLFRHVSGLWLQSYSHASLWGFNPARFPSGRDEYIMAINAPILEDMVCFIRVLECCDHSCTV